MSPLHSSISDLGFFISTCLQGISTRISYLPLNVCVCVCLPSSVLLILSSPCCFNLCTLLHYSRHSWFRYHMSYLACGRALWMPSLCSLILSFPCDLIHMPVVAQLFSKELAGIISCPIQRLPVPSHAYQGPFTVIPHFLCHFHPSLLPITHVTFPSK